MCCWFHCITEDDDRAAEADDAKRAEQHPSSRAANDSARSTAHAASVTTRTGIDGREVEAGDHVNAPPLAGPPPGGRRAPHRLRRGDARVHGRVPTICSHRLPDRRLHRLQEQPGNTPITMATAQIGAITAHSRELRSRSAAVLRVRERPVVHALEHPEHVDGRQNHPGGRDRRVDARTGIDRPLNAPSRIRNSPTKPFRPGSTDRRERDEQEAATSRGMTPSGRRTRRSGAYAGGRRACRR